jgi:hypothetical protein
MESSRHESSTLIHGIGQIQPLALIGLKLHFLGDYPPRVDLAPGHHLHSLSCIHTPITAKAGQKLVILQISVTPSSATRL